jgi:undecaprenyl-diphosphatase
MFRDRHMTKKPRERIFAEKFLQDLPGTINEFAIELLVVFSLLLVSSLLFYILIHFIIPEKENILDHTAFLIFQPLVSPAHTQFAKIVTFFGTGSFLIPCYTLIVALLLRDSYLKYAIMTSTIAVSSLALGWILKDIFHRSRPSYHLVTGAGGYSFPSGHALGGFVFTGVILYIIWQTRKSFHIKCLFSALICIWGIAVGLSRIYLHVHYATDVLGSLLIALFWLSLLYIFFRALYGQKMHFKENETEIDFSPSNYHLDN